jgi:uncharacterized membrane protein
MNIRIPLMVSLLALTAMLAASAWGWFALPTDARMAVHWGLDGHPNGYMPKAPGLLLLPGIAMALTALFVVLPAIEPRRANLAASRKLYFTGWIGGIIVLAAVQFIVVMTAAGLHVDVLRWTTIALAAFFVVLGNFLGKSRSTFFVGLRLPWTLASALAWEKGNRTAGRGLVASGLLSLAALFLAGTVPGFALLMTGTLLSVTAGGIASYLYWTRDTDRQNGDSIHG